MVLEAHDVTFSYDGARNVLHRVDLRVAPDEIVALIGPNGSGKSTLIKVMADLQRLRHGTVTVAGHRHERREAKSSMMYLASNDYLPEFLTGLEYLKYMHGLYGADVDLGAVESCFERYQMAGRHRDLIEDYSHGMRKKVQLVAALLLQRPVTVIDETLNGVDIDAVYTFEQDLAGLCRQGRGVLLCSHDFRMLEKVAHRVCFLHRGLLVEDLPMPQVLSEHGSLDSLVRDYVAVLREPA